MNSKIEGIITVLAALLVVFTAIMDPKISIGIAVTLLVALAIYKLAKEEKR